MHYEWVFMKLFVQVQIVTKKVNEKIYKTQQICIPTWQVYVKVADLFYDRLFCRPYRLASTTSSSSCIFKCSFRLGIILGVE